MMTKPHIFVLISGLLALSGSMSGCAQFAPQAMPKGYTYQDNTPLSSPAPSSPWSKKSVMADTNNLATNTIAWQGAVYELVSQMENTLPKDGTPLNLTAKDTSSLNTSFDHYLRQILVQKGYNLTTLPKTGKALVFSAEKTTGKTAVAGEYALTANLLDDKGNPSSTGMVKAILPFEK